MMPQPEGSRVFGAGPGVGLVRESGVNGPGLAGSAALGAADQLAGLGPRSSRPNSQAAYTGRRLIHLFCDASQWDREHMTLALVWVKGREWDLA